jgi:hypothetical protein
MRRVESDKLTLPEQLVLLGVPFFVQALQPTLASSGQRGSTVIPLNVEI